MYTFTFMWIRDKVALHVKSQNYYLFFLKVFFLTPLPQSYISNLGWHEKMEESDVNGNPEEDL